MKEYQRLPGRRLLNSARHSLWLGQDHLMAISRFSYTEEYKRFYFRDIQGICIQKTLAGWIWNLVFGIILFLTFMMFITAPPSIHHDYFDPKAGIYLIFSVINLFFLLLNLFRGPTCVCRLKTRVQTVTLSSIHRIPAAMKVIKKIQPLVEDAQKDLTPSAHEDVLPDDTSAAKDLRIDPLQKQVPPPLIQQVNDDIDTSNHEVTQNPKLDINPLPPIIHWPQNQQITPPAPNAQRSVPPPLRTAQTHHFPLKFHWVFFSLSLIVGVMILIQMFFNSFGFMIVSMVFNGSLWVTLVGMMIEQRKYKIQAELRNIGWWAFGFFIGLAFIWYLVLVFEIFQRGLKGENTMFMNDFWEMIKILYAFSLQKSPFLNAVFLLSVIGHLLLSFAGFRVLLRQRTEMT